MEQIFGNLSMLTEFPVINVKIIVDGLMIGSLFALAAYGLALVWGVMNIKNLAQGDFVIFGGYMAWWLAGLGLPPLLGVPAAFAMMWALGWVIYKLVISRVIERDLFTSLLATFGLAIMLAQILNLLFGSDTQSIKLPYDTLYFFDGFVDVPIAKLPRRAAGSHAGRRRRHLYENQPHGASHPRHRPQTPARRGF